MSNLSIQPGLALVAAPHARMGSFDKCVVLLTEHHARGSVGFRLNYPARFDLSWVYATKGIEYSGDNRLYDGGPINPNSLVILHTNDWTNSNTLSINSNLSISSDGLMMDKLAENNTARQWRAFSGYSGWLRNQLASEISDKRWLVCRLDNRGIFDLDGEAQWLYAVDMCAAQAMAQYI